MRWLMALLLVGCTPDFPDPTTVQDLRLLDVSADISEVLVDVGPLAALDQLPDQATLAPLLVQAAATLPASFPPITLQPLVVDPHGQGRPVHFRVVTCVNLAGGQSGEGMGLGMGMGGAGRIRDTVDRDPCPEGSPLLGEGDGTPGPDGVVPFPVQLTVTREVLLAAITADPLGVVFGLPLTIQFTVSAGEESVIARKRVVFTPRLAPDQTPNRNPTLPGLLLRRTTDDPGTPFNLADPAAAPLEVPLATDVSFDPARGETETYSAKVLDRGTTHLSLERSTEALRYSFFATAGDFGPATTTTDPPTIRTPGPHPLATTYHAPDKLPAGGDLVRVWIVVRDERAGSSWSQVVIRLVP
jgi:hypothetical protein